MKKVDLYVLDEAMRFDKKFYGVWGKPFPKPISVKSVLYFLIPLGILGAMNFIPVLNTFAISFKKAGMLYFLIPYAISYLMGDSGTDERSPFKYIRAIIFYGYRKIMGVSYYRGRILSKPKTHKFYSVLFGGYLTYREKGGRNKQ